MASKKMKRKKFIRTVSGKVRIGQQVKKTKKRQCILCKSQLHGVPHGKSKAMLAQMSKTEKRPSAIFGGKLCSKCRRKVIDAAIMVKQNSKSMPNVDLSLKKFVIQTTEKMK